MEISYTLDVKYPHPTKPDVESTLIKFVQSELNIFGANVREKKLFLNLFAPAKDAVKIAKQIVNNYKLVVATAENPILSDWEIETDSKKAVTMASYQKQKSGNLFFRVVCVPKDAQAPYDISEFGFAERPELTAIATSIAEERELTNSSNSNKETAPALQPIEIETTGVDKALFDKDLPF